MLKHLTGVVFVSAGSVGATNMNEHSSRSHAIFTITIECSEKGIDGNQHVRMGKLHLVDLAVRRTSLKTSITFDVFHRLIKLKCCDGCFLLVRDLRGRVRQEPPGSVLKRPQRSTCPCPLWAMWSPLWWTGRAHTCPTGIPNSRAYCKTLWEETLKPWWYRHTQFRLSVLFHT